MRKKYEKYMRSALDEANIAFNNNEVPIGCIIVKNNEIIAKGHNQVREKGDATCHAEMNAIRLASKKIGDFRLNGCELYVTLEPCPMCAGAIVNSRIEKVIFGASDKVMGSGGTVVDLFNQKTFYHNVNVVGGIMEEECLKKIRNFFEKRRKENKIK